MKRKKMKGIRKVLSTTLSLSLVFSMTSNFALAAAPVKSTSSSNSGTPLSQLSKSERLAVHKLTAAPSFSIDPKLENIPESKVDVIVELKTNRIELTKDKKSFLINPPKELSEEQVTFKKRLINAKSNDTIGTYKIKRVYNYSFNGLAMTVNSKDLQAILKTGLVKRIWKDNVVKLPKEEMKNVESTQQANIPTPLSFLGVDNLHNEGVNGQGVKVGVLDTGIDYNHPDLKDNYKGGFDFVDNDNDPMETTYKDWQKANQETGAVENNGEGSYYTEHGTHVSGTIASTPKNNVDYAMTGVAPKADLYVYRVLGPYGQGMDSWIMAGIDRAAKDGMNVINLSLGKVANDSLDPTSVAINNAAILGVIPVISAGNAGPTEGTLGAPGTSSLAITVGASDVPTNEPLVDISMGSLKVNGKLFAHGLSNDYQPIMNQTYSIVDVKYGAKEDFSGVDVKGKIALISRGNLSFDEKISNAQSAGAIGALIYNNVDGEIPFFLDMGAKYIPTFSLTKEDGLALQASVSPVNSQVTLDNLRDNQVAGDHLADFSSRGPVANNYDIKPDVVAPGVAILSSIPEDINNPGDEIDYTKAYASLNGTSMASPHVAGIAALILQAHPKYSVSDVKAILMNTADPMNGEYNVNEIGAGRVDPVAAVKADQIVETIRKAETVNDNNETVPMDDVSGSLPFGSITQHGDAQSRVIQVSVKNNKATAVNYSARYVFNKIEGVTKDGEKNGVTLELPDKFTVDANGKYLFDAKITIPKSAQIGRYEGYVYFKAEGVTEEIRVPFSAFYTEPGINNMQLDRNATSNDFSSNEVMPYPLVSLTFKLNSKMKEMGVYIKDLDGKVLGLVSEYDYVSQMQPNVTYFTYAAFMGAMLKATGDTNKPFETNYTAVPEGKYILSLVGVDEYGDTYSVEDDMVVDNTPPELTLDKPLGKTIVKDSDLTVEVADDGAKYTAYWVHGQIHDDTIDYLIDRGHDLDHSATYVGVYQDDQWFPYTLNVDGEGNFKFGVAKEEYTKQATELNVMAMGYSSAGKFAEDSIVLMGEDTPFGAFNTSATNVELGDVFSNSYTIHKVQDISSGRFYAEVPSQYEVQKIEPSAQLKELAATNGWNINFSKPVYQRATGWTVVKMNYSFTDKVTGAAVGYTGNSLDILDMDLEVVKDNFFTVKDKISQFGNYYKDTQDNFYSVSTYGTRFHILSKNSVVDGYARGEAVQWWDSDHPIDYLSMGINAYVEDEEGHQFKASIDEIGYLTFENIPAIEAPYTLVVKVPGHYEYREKVTLSKMRDGIPSGTYYFLYYETSAAGDVNSDNVIDIYDARAIALKAGATGTNLAEDINKDGVVDSKDFNYIEKNYNTWNPYVPKTHEPKLTYGTMTIDNYKAKVTNIKDITPPKPPTVDSIANDDLCITGKTEANGGAIAYTFNDNYTLTVLGQVDTDEFGNFKIPLKEKLKEKANIAVCGIDAAGNQGDYTWVGVTDVIGPLSLNVNQITDKDVEIKGTTDKGAKVVAKVDGNEIKSTTADDQGQFTLTLDQPLPKNTQVVIETYDENNTLGQSVTVTVLDTTKPEKAVVNPITNKDLKIQGQAEPNAIVDASVDGVSVASGTVPQDGTFKLQLESTIDVGKVVTVTVKDSGNNVSEAVTVTVSDVIAPLKPYLTKVTNASKSIVGFGEVGAKAIVTVNGVKLGEATVEESGAFEMLLSAPLKVGTQVSVTLTDAAGNVSVERVITVIDVIAPLAPTVAALNTASTKVEGKTEANATVTVYVSGNLLASTKADATGLYSVPVTGLKVTSAVKVVATDGSNNVSKPTTVYVRLQAPTISKVTIKSTRVSGKTVAKATVKLYINGKYSTKVTADKKGYYLFTINKQKVGTELRVRATDLKNNVSLPAITTVLKK